jgi:chromosome segregation ATPase
MTLAQELEQTKAQLASLQSTVTASNATAETFNVKIAALEADKAALISEKETLAEAVAAHAEEIKLLKANAKSAEARALEIAASAGVPPVAAQPQNPEPESLESKIAKMPNGAEKLKALVALFDAQKISNPNKK